MAIFGMRVHLVGLSALPVTETAELHRQGAKSAARGESQSANPLEWPQNCPSSTGESMRRWGERHAAWLRGYRSQSRSSG